MAIDRRTLLAGASASLLEPAVLLAGEKAPLFVSAARSDGKHCARVFDLAGRPVAVVDLPGRGHGCASSPTGDTAVIFARRPESFAVAFRPGSGRLVAVISAPQGRHFYGHGAFSRNGRVLFTSENDFDNECGVIGVWDVAAGFRRVGEWSSFGIGPHEIVSTTGDLLAVANGGIATHPDTGRRKLNIPEMDPSLALIDTRSGDLVGECRLPRDLHKLSIRHLATVGSAPIVVAMQYEGPVEDVPPLIFTWDSGEPLLLEAPLDVQRAMHNYCGSVATDVGGEVAAVSCPRGNIVTFWNVAAGKLLCTLEVRDGCGIAAIGRKRAFLITAGSGERIIYDPVRRLETILPKTPKSRWDNHVTGT